MESGAGIYRDAKGLEAAAGRISEIQERFANAALDDHSLTFNTERIAWLELSNMLDLAEAIIASALERRESRGAHQRTDHPRRDDARYLAHSLAHRADDGSRIEYLPVTITRWPPGERVYGR
jgi:fumarate reductase flavoprotein subunit